MAAAKAEDGSGRGGGGGAAVAAALADSLLHVTAVDVRSERLHTSAAPLLPRRNADGHTLELNPDHPLVVQLAQGVTAEEGEDVVRERAELLAQLGAVAAGVGAVNQAALAERLARAAAAAPPPRKRRRDAAGGWLRRILARLTSACETDIACASRAVHEQGRVDDAQRRLIGARTHR